MGSTVAVTINGMSDYAAMQQADVTICSSTQCDVIKQSADIILTEYNFDKLEDALMMGKQVYKNVQKFLTFNITTTFMVGLVNIFFAFHPTHIPLNIV